MDADTQAQLHRLAAGLASALRRDARALEDHGAGPGRADLEGLANKLEALLAIVAAHPDDLGVQRTLVMVLSEVEAFHGRVRQAHAATKTALRGVAERHAAGRAYTDALRYGAAGDAA